MAGVGDSSPLPGQDHDYDASLVSSLSGNQRASITSPRGGSRERVSALAAQTVNEASPLLPPRNLIDTSKVSNSSATLTRYESSVPSRSTLYLMILTLGVGGLQIAWCVELSNGSPYLLSLGLSKSLMALVWIAGPLSGSLVQPYIGIQSDNSRLPWGKRRPFMIAGVLTTVISLLALAWTRELVQGVMSVFGAGPESKATTNAIMVVAILFVYALDFAINTGKIKVLAPCLLGMEDLLTTVGFAVEAAIRAFIVDNAPTHQQDSANSWAGRMAGFGNILGYLPGYVNLPKAIPFFGNTQFKVLCVIASIALGGTVAISCLYVKERDPREEGPPAPGKDGVIGFFKQVFKSVRRLPPQTRSICVVQFFAWMGWFPFMFYITTYIGELYVTPFLEENPNLTKGQVDELWEKATRIGTFALLIFAITSFSTNIFLPFFVAPNCFNIKAPHHPILSKLVIRRLTLRRAWFLSHVLYAVAMWFTFFVRSTGQAIVLVGIVGVSWALTLWAPFALISAEISKRETLRRDHLQNPNRPHPLGDDGGDQAGVILGLHNIAMSAPQVISTLSSSFVFRLLQKKRGEIGDNSVGWVLRLGGIATLVAAWMTTKVAEEGEASEVLEGFLTIVNEGTVVHG